MLRQTNKEHYLRMHHRRYHNLDNDGDKEERRWREYSVLKHLEDDAHDDSHHYLRVIN